MITRLQDPSNLSGEKFPELAEKIAISLTRMSRKMPQGSPFHYAYLAPAVHEISNKVPTAATNGRKYFWNPEFLSGLTPDQVSAVLIHEAYHTILFHCSRGHRDAIWNLAIDFVVNAIIMVDHQINMQSMFPEHFTIEQCKASMATGSEISGICLDKSAHGRKAEDIYDELIQAADQAKKSASRCSGGSGEGDSESASSSPDNQGSKSSHDPMNPNVSGGIDSHLDEQEAGAQEVADKVREALATAEAIGGKLPGNVAGLLDGALVKLEKPKVDLKTMIYGIAKKIQAGRGGVHLDYKKPRRRNGYLDLGFGRVTMVPVRAKQPKLHYAVCMDTSGSMSDHDINATVSQLQTLTDICSGCVVPNDTKPYWEAKVDIGTTFELQKVRVKGRGGTDYSEFFNEYKSKIGTVDFIVVLTDGYFGMPPKPGVPVIWVVVNNSGFTASYGKVVHLR